MWSMRLRHLVLLLAGLVASMALAGCDVTGTVTVRADDQVELDLRAVIDADQSCDWQLGPGVRTDERRMRNSAQRLCLLQGTVSKEALRKWWVNVAHNGEHIEVVVNPLGVVAPNDEEWTTLGVTDLAVQVQFPGQVIESTGIEEGNTVRFTDVSQLGRPQGLRAVALDHAGPSLGLVLPFVAFGLGVFAMGVLWASVNRQALLDRFSATPTATLGRRPDVPGQTRTLAYPAIPAPGSLLPADLREELGAPPATQRPDEPARGSPGTGWERPGWRPVPPDDPVPGDDAPARPEHAKWAPPEGPD